MINNLINKSQFFVNIVIDRNFGRGLGCRRHDSMLNNLLTLDCSFVSSFFHGRPKCHLHHRDGRLPIGLLNFFTFFCSAISLSLRKKWWGESSCCAAFVSKQVLTLASSSFFWCCCSATSSSLAFVKIERWSSCCAAFVSKTSTHLGFFLHLLLTKWRWKRRGRLWSDGNKWGDTGRAGDEHVRVARAVAVARGLRHEVLLHEVWSTWSST